MAFKLESLFMATVMAMAMAMAMAMVMATVMAMDMVTAMVHMAMDLDIIPKKKKKSLF